jgi:hypothetical protein
VNARNEAMAHAYRQLCEELSAALYEEDPASMGSAVGAPHTTVKLLGWRRSCGMCVLATKSCRICVSYLALAPNHSPSELIRL